MFSAYPFGDESSWSDTTTRLWEAEVDCGGKDWASNHSSVSPQFVQMHMPETQLKWDQGKWNRGERVLNGSGNLSMVGWPQRQQFQELELFRTCPLHIQCFGFGLSYCQWTLLLLQGTWSLAVLDSNIDGPSPGDEKGSSLFGASKKGHGEKIGSCAYPWIFHPSLFFPWPRW